MSSAEVQQLVAEARPGSRIALNVWREGTVLRIVAEAVEIPAEPSDSAPAAIAARDVHLGLRLGELGAAERRALRIQSGVQVIDVRGAALRAGIRPRDVIVAVNQFPVSSLLDFEAALARIPNERAPALLVRRSGAFSYVVVPPAPGSALP